MYGKIHPRTGHEGPESKYWYIFILSLTSALNKGGLSTPRSGRFPPAGGDNVLTLQEDGWAPGPVCWVRKISSHYGIRSPVRPARSE